jgi:hypothetical protein
MKDSLFMETTKISATRTAQQICSLLAESGASAVLTEYDENRKISGLSFKLKCKGEIMPFSLPVRTDSVYEILHGRRVRNPWNHEEDDRQQAERVAWRQLLRWVEAQLSLISIGMSDVSEVFFAYIQTGPHETLYQRLTASGRLALPAAKGNVHDSQ